MASHSVMVGRSGNVYLVGTRETAIIVDMNEDTTSPKLATQSILAHLYTNKPWEAVTDLASMPARVVDAIAEFTDP